jgi:hypothetical protein
MRTPARAKNKPLNPKPAPARAKNLLLWLLERMASSACWRPRPTTDWPASTIQDSLRLGRSRVGTELTIAEACKRRPRRLFLWRGIAWLRLTIESSMGARYILTISFDLAFGLLKPFASRSRFVPLVHRFSGSRVSTPAREHA